MRSILPDGTWAAKSRKIYELDAKGNKIFQKIDKLGRKQYKSQMVTVVNTVNEYKQSLAEEKSVSDSDTPEVLRSENPTELCN